MLTQLVKNKYYFFITKAVGLYVMFYCIYEFYIKKHTTLDQLFIRKLIHVCTSVLETFGYHTFASKETNDVQVFGIDGSNGVWIGGPCNGINLMFLFAIFIIAYPSNGIKQKLWFIPLGILIVHTVNIIRIVSLSLIALYAPEYLDFNHTYTFTFLVYSIVFGLWMLWVNIFAEKK